MINQLSVPDFVKLTKMSFTSVCDVADEFSISHFQHLSFMHQYPWCHLPGSWLRVIDIHQTFPRFWNASFSVKLHSWNVLNVWKVFLLDLPICCILVELIRWNPILSRHVNATKSYLHFCCFAGEAILCCKPYFQIVGSSKEKKSWIELKFYCFFMI